MIGHYICYAQLSSCPSILLFAHVIKGKAHSRSCMCCLLKEALGVFETREEEAKHGKSRRCLRYREGSPLYVTHFLYHIPRLDCVSSVFSLFGTNSCWQSSHSSSACRPLRNKQQEMKRRPDSLSDYYR